jgi:dTMP kinase
MPGRFITFEGGEGVGKSTQVARLARRIEASGIKVVATREPGGSPRAERIREVLLGGGAKRFGPLGEALLLCAARADHLEALIRPALRRGAFVICDRFADSTRAYQGAVGEVEDSVVRGLERIVVGETRPNLTVVLDAPVALSLARAAERGGPPDRFEAEGRGFHHRLRQAFLDIAAREPDRCVVVDASLEADRIEENVWNAVAARWPDELGAGTPARRAAHGG